LTYTTARGLDPAAPAFSFALSRRRGNPLTRSFTRSDMIRIVTLLAASCWAATASAQQWADKMFAQHSHDFGSVPRAAKVEYEFVVTNLYNQDIHIASVSASCSCTQPR